MSLLIFGSSITWGAWDEEGGWAQRIKNFSDKKAADSNYENYTSVYCLGVSGDNTEDLLQRFETELKARIDETEKTSIIIEIGINDSQFMLADSQFRVSPENYKQNLLKLIEISKKYQADLVFVGLTPVDDNLVDPIPWKQEASYRFEFVKKFDLILKETCEEQKIPFIELMSKFMEKDYRSLLTDGLHPNTQGHQIIFEEALKYLSERGLV